MKMNGLSIVGRILGSTTAASDPYFSNVVLLANASGSNVIDQSSYAVTLSPTGGVSESATIYKFANTKSIEFTSGSGGVSVPYVASKFDLANTVTTWTVESWVYLQGPQSSIQTYRLDVAGNQSLSSGWETCITPGGVSIVYPGYGGPAGSGTVMTSGTWYHLVWMRNGTNYSYGANGVITNTSTYTGGTAPAGFMRLGANYNNFVGITYNLQDVRITDGIIRYPGPIGATYTVPTTPFPTM